MRTVFHVSSSAPDDQEHALANVANLLNDDSVYEASDDVVVVANGPGVQMLASASATAPDRVERLRDDGVSFYACQNSLGTRDLTPADLLAGVETVPSGSGALARLQDDGYGYVKAP